MVAGIIIQNLVKTYRGGTIRALNNLSLNIAPSEIVGILGHNGAGKTTLLGCLLGLLRPDSGSITIEGQSPDSLAIRTITGYLPERLVFDRWMTGKAFLCYHHALANLPAQQREADVEMVLKKLDMGAASHKLINKYSRGMLQRIGFAQALLGNPQYLFLDEPTSGVDPAGLVIFRNILKELKDQGVTIILNSHQLDEVERICDRVIFVSKGQIMATKDVSELTNVARVLIIKLADNDLNLTESQLNQIAQTSGVACLRFNTQEARFSVPNDQAASRLIANLVAAQIPIIEATPEESRLEQMFLQHVNTTSDNTANLKESGSR